MFKTIPVLASLNIAESAAFYTEKLAFTLKLKTDNYLIVEREGAELHFWLCAEKHIAENTSCYIRLNQVDALFNELQSRGLQLNPPVSQAWGVRELYLLDPHGNLLKFGETLG